VNEATFKYFFLNFLVNQDTVWQKTYVVTVLRHLLVNQVNAVHTSTISFIYARVHLVQVFVILPSARYIKDIEGVVTGVLHCVLQKQELC
jgi:hypothetical protein